MSNEQSSQSLDWEHLLNVALESPGQVGAHYTAFYPYSFLNQMFLLEQGCPVEPIATYNRWQELGRQVVKGAKAHAIIRPITIKREDEESGETKTFQRFKPVRCIFPASATDGEPLPPIKVPEWDEELALANLKIERVPFGMFDGNAQGWSYERQLAVSPVAKYAGKTLLHEAAHIVSGHTTADNLSQYQEHRGRFELEAEAPAYLISKELGISDDEQDSSSRGYIQGWLRGEKPGEQSIRRIFQTTDAILKAGRTSVSTEAAA